MFLALLAGALQAQEEKGIYRLGLIGLDTSHVIAFTGYINEKTHEHGCKIVAGYPGGSPDVESSASRVEGFTQELRDKHGLVIVDSVEALVDRVDGVLLESVDGRPHLEQARPVIRAGKPLFIDKPMAGNLSDVLEIFRLARENNVPCWSSSSLRYSPGIIGMRKDPEVGDVLGCEAFSPCHLEEHHPDFYWYGVHGVEILFTIMGTGCQTVQRTHCDGVDLAVGVWEGGRIGTFRGLRQGKQDYGALVYGSKGIKRSGSYAGYGPLCDEIVLFFQTKRAPVPPEETIEIFAFMTAADISKERGGIPVTLEEVLKEAQ